jgi:hypothetical protein
VRRVLAEAAAEVLVVAGVLGEPPLYSRSRKNTSPPVAMETLEDS